MWVSWSKLLNTTNTGVGQVQSDKHVKIKINYHLSTPIRKYSINKVIVQLLCTKMTVQRESKNCIIL